MGYFAVPFSSALACARKTDGDSLIFRTNSEAFFTEFRTIGSHHAERISASDEFDLHTHSVQHVAFLKENIAVDATDHVEFANLSHEVASRLQTLIWLIAVRWCRQYRFHSTRVVFVEQFARELRLLSIFAVTE